MLTVESMYINCHCVKSIKHCDNEKSIGKALNIHYKVMFISKCEV